MGICEASCNAEQAAVLEFPGVCMLWYGRTSVRMTSFRLKNEASFLDMNNTISADFAIKKSPYAELHFQVPGNSRRFLIHKL